MTPITKSELLYRLYLFGYAHQITLFMGQMNIRPIMNSMTFDLYKKHFTQSKFNVEFNKLCESKNTNIDAVYKNAKPPIDFFMDQLFNFNI